MHSIRTAQINRRSQSHEQINIGKQLYDQEKYHAAIEKFNNALQIDESNFVAYRYKGYHLSLNSFGT